MTDFQDQKQIGKGKDCTVYSATCAKLGGMPVVLKVYDALKISVQKMRSVRREACIMKYLGAKGVPHVIGFLGAFQDATCMYIVMQYAPGGDLLELLLREGRALTEQRAVREVVLPVLTALAHLHALGIIHRDIKLENLFVDDGADRGGILVGDFGLSMSVHEEKAISPVGTLEYMPPEILRLPPAEAITSGRVCAHDVTPVDEKVDVWSFGVTLYELLTGRTPFEGGSKDEVKASILRGRQRRLPDFLSPECRDFVCQALTPAAASRPGCIQLLRHPWVAARLPADAAARVAAMTPAALAERLRGTGGAGAGGGLDGTLAGARVGDAGVQAAKLCRGGSKDEMAGLGSPRTEGGILAYVPPPLPRVGQLELPADGVAAGPAVRGAVMSPGGGGGRGERVGAAGAAAYRAAGPSPGPGDGGALGAPAVRRAAQGGGADGSRAARSAGAVSGANLRWGGSGGSSASGPTPVVAGCGGLPASGSTGSTCSTNSVVSLADSVSSVHIVTGGGGAKAELCAREPIWEGAEEAAEAGGGGAGGGGDGGGPAGEAAAGAEAAQAGKGGKGGRRGRKWLCVFKQGLAQGSSDTKI